MKYDVLILGAGMVGVSCALHLQSKGKSVVLIDRKQAGEETSFGNAGFIQREAVEPYNFPRELSTIVSAASNRRLDIRYHSSALFELVKPLTMYFHNSSNKYYPNICKQYETIVERCLITHEPLIEQANAQNLIHNKGWIELYRTQQNLEKAFAHADKVKLQSNIQHEKLNAQQLKIHEPAIQEHFVGGVLWTDPVTINNPGNLVKTYANLFTQRGGSFQHANALGLEKNAQSVWEIVNDQGELIQANDVVIALGPWSTKLTQKFGYNPPLFVKRGYHMHYENNSAIPLNRAMLDAERGFVIAPMQKGIRLATGAELAQLDAPATPNQLNEAEIIARQSFPLGKRLDPEPWKGARPCMPDMKPVIGALPNQKGLWCAFGHGHQGFTLGPATGELLADLIVGEKTKIDSTPFNPNRNFWI